MAGWTTQTCIFPIDAAKSRVQLSVNRHSSGGVGIGGAFMQLFRERALYRGLSVQYLRAIPVHMAYLPVFTLCMHYLDPQMYE